MKRIAAACASVLLAAFAFATVPDKEFSLDTQNSSATWELKWVYTATTPLLRGKLAADGTDWKPSSDWAGFLWYGTNASWGAGGVTKIAGTFSTNNAYIDFQCSATDFPTSGVFYGGVVMTNATQTIEWGLGKVYVRDSGGVGSSSSLALGSQLPWSTFSMFTGSAVYGPVRAGTGLTASTNADGSLTFASTGGTSDLAKAVADITYAPISVTIDAASNSAMAGATATFLPQAGGNLTGADPTITGTASATAPSVQFQNSAGLALQAGGSGTEKAVITLNGGASSMSPGRITIGATNSITMQIGASASDPAWKMYSDGSINGYGKQWTNFVSTQYWQADTAVVATNDFNYSYIKAKKFAYDITVTQVDGQSSCGTGNWMICQGRSPASWITNGTYTSSTTGDVSTVAFTLYSTNRLYFDLLGATCDGYPTNLVGMGASGTFQQTN